MEINTERLLLREYTESDFSTFHNFRTDKHINQYLRWDDVSIDNSKELLNSFIIMSKSYNRQSYDFLIINKETNEAIGQASLDVRIRNNYGGIGVLGFFLKKSSWGNGFINEASLELLKYGFHKLKLHKISADSKASNKKSINVLKRLGMKKCGLFKEEILEGNKWIDMVFYSISSTEFEQIIKKKGLTTASTWTKQYNSNEILVTLLH